MVSLCLGGSEIFLNGVRALIGFVVAFDVLLLLDGFCPNLVFDIEFA